MIPVFWIVARWSSSPCFPHLSPPFLFFRHSFTTCSAHPSSPIPPAALGHSRGGRYPPGDLRQRCGAENVVARNVTANVTAHSETNAFALYLFPETFQERADRPSSIPPRPLSGFFGVGNNAFLGRRRGQRRTTKHVLGPGTRHPTCDNKRNWNHPVTGKPLQTKATSCAPAVTVGLSATCAVACLSLFPGNSCAARAHTRPGPGPRQNIVRFAPANRGGWLRTRKGDWSVLTRSGRCRCPHKPEHLEPHKMTRKRGNRAQEEDGKKRHRKANDTGSSARRCIREGQSTHEIG